MEESTVVKPKRKKMGRTQGDKLFALALLIPGILTTVLFILVPLVDSIYRSLFDYKVSNIISGKPGIWNNFDNYLNFIVAGSVAFLTTSIAILSGYSLSRFNFKWNGWIIALFTSAQMFPVVSRLISLYKILGEINLINTRFGLIIAVTAGMLPFSTMLMSSFFDGIPKEIEEAARVDGASRLGVLFQVVMPIVKSGVVAVGIYSFLLAWDDYLHAATLIQTDKLRTLSTGIALRYLGELSYDWSLINTISVVATIPMIVVFFFFQKHMVKGLVAGAVKG